MPPELVELSRSTGAAAVARRRGSAGRGGQHAAVHAVRHGLLLYLGAFAGFLLYIGASDILPEAHTNHPSQLTLVTTVAGTALIWILVRVIGG